MRRAAGLFLAVLFAGSCGDPKPQGPLQIKFGHVGDPGSLFALSSEEFARRVNEQMAGEIHASVFGSSQLGGDDVLLQKLLLGSVDLALPSSIMSSRVPEFGVFDMPHLVDDRDHMKRIEREIVWPELAPMARERGYEILAVWENGFRHITNNVRPIRSPKDLAGIKLRTPAGEWRVKMFQAWGANPTPLPLSETFVALQTGVVDGQENPLAQIHASKLHEVQKFLSLTRHIYTPGFVTMGAARWKQLTDAQQKALKRIAEETQGYVYETGARLEAELETAIRDAGLAVNAVDEKAFAEADAAVYKEFAATLPKGGELVARARALSDRGSKEK
jgi:tripartite ATP-independent transporter DctP family solute receptor